MHKLNQHEKLILAAAVGLSIAFALIDLLLPLGVAGGILHVPIVLLTLWLPGRPYTVGFGLIGTALAIVGYFGSPIGGAYWNILFNRLLAVFGMWVAAFFVIQFKNKQQALHESEARNQLILDTAGDGIVTFDQDGTIQSMNRAAERIFGYEPNAAVGREMSILFANPEHMSKLPLTGRNGVAASNGQEAERTEELIGRRNDGSAFPMRISLSRVTLERGALNTVVVRDITNRRRVERKLVGLPEDERQQIGYDLHEGVGQMLNGIKLLTEDLANTLDESNHDSAGDAHRVVDLLTEADDQVAELIYQLTPVNLAANELSAALETLLETTGDREGIETEIVTTGRQPVRDNTVVTHLYRIAREAVTNAVEHGRAKRVRIQLHEGADEIQLSIEDDGVGFPDRVDQVKGMGIRVMEYRAGIIGATLKLETMDSGGTRVSCTLARRHELLEQERSAV